MKRKNMHQYLKSVTLNSKVVEDNSTRNSLCSIISDSFVTDNDFNSDVSVDNDNTECVGEEEVGDSSYLSDKSNSIDFFKIKRDKVSLKDVKRRKVKKNPVKSEKITNYLKKVEDKKEHSEIKVEDISKEIQGDVLHVPIKRRESMKDLLSSEVMSKVTDSSSSNSSFVLINKSLIIKDKKIIVDDNKSGIKTDCPSIEERINRIKQFAPVRLSDIDISYSKVNKHILLPKSYLSLSKLFTVALSIQKYNQSRNLTSIFIKNKDCIEDMLKRRVSLIDFEKINYLVSEYITFKRINMEHNGVETPTFTYKIDCTAELFDKRLFQYLLLQYKEYLERENKIPTVSHTFVKDFNIELVKDIPRKKIFDDMVVVPKEDQPIENGMTKKVVVPKAGVSKRLSILERIKERERLRKEEFIRNCNQEDEIVKFIKKIESHFKKEGKKAIKVKKLIELFKVFDGEAYFKRVFSSPVNSIFSFKEIFGEEHLIYENDH